MGVWARRGSTLLAVGGFVVLVTSWVNRPAAWRPLVLPATSSTDRAAVVLRTDAEYEMVLEAGEDAPSELLRELAAPGRQTHVEGRWTVHCDGELVAEGTTSEYLRVLSLRATAGRARRILAREPFGQDELSYRTFGLAGRFLVERAVGRWTVPAGGGLCEVGWTPTTVVTPARLAVRRSHDQWRAHYRAVAVLAFTGAGLVMAGLSMLAVAVTRRRSAGHPRERAGR